MNILTWAMTLALLIEWHYRCHKVNIRLRPCGYLKDPRRLIFQVIPLPGTRKKDIFYFAEDVQAAMPVPLPLFQPFAKGIQIFLTVSTVPVRENSLWKLLTSPEFRNSDQKLSVALGYDLMGEPVIEDLDEIVHAMYVGAPGSGKSVGLLCLILSLVCAHPASEVNLIVFDIGSDTLDVLKDLPHLSYPIVKDRDEGAYVIQSLMDEMERRYSLEHSQRCNLPAIVCVMDEFNSFIGNNRKEVADNISNLLRRGRKVAFHSVLATQDPRNQKMVVEIGNITTRMAFKVDRYQTSTSIINHGGAEKLPGNGAMLYRSANYPDSIYVQGAYISDDEAAELVWRIKAAEQDLSNKFVIPEYSKSDLPAPFDGPADAVQADNKKEQEFASIILWTLERKEISSLKIRQRFKMGNRADEIMDKLWEFGLISEKFANQPRTVLPQSIEGVPNEVMRFLTRCSVTADDVATALSKRSSDNLVDQEGEGYV